MPLPEPTGGRRKRELLTGDVPSPANPPRACRFHTRCPKAQEQCSIDEPPLSDKETGTLAACHFPLGWDEVRELLPTALVGLGANGADGHASGSASSSASPSSSSSST